MSGVSRKTIRGIALCSVLRSPVASYKYFRYVYNVVPRTGKFVVMGERFSRVAPINVAFKRLTSVANKKIRAPKFVKRKERFVSSGGFTCTRNKPREVI